MATKKDSSILPLPKWFKDEMAREKEREQQENWKKAFEIHEARASTNLDRALRDAPQKIREVASRDDAPEGLLQTAKKILKAVKMHAKANTCILVVGVAALTYLISPIDSIPDFIPGVGLMDDAFLLAAAWERITHWFTDTDKMKLRKRW